MSSAKQEILRRIGVALTDRPVPEPVLRDYRQAGFSAVDLGLFVERLADYRATVHRCPDPGDIAAAVRQILGGRGLSRIVVPDGLPAEWLPAVEVLPAVELLPAAEWLREPLTVAELDTAEGVLTSCAVAVAETGTIVLDGGPGMGRRALTLVPDYHLIVVRAEQVVAIVPDAVARLEPTRPLTWISGPSATSDIELDRVEGVHGPRTLDVLLLG